MRFSSAPGQLALKLVPEGKELLLVIVQLHSYPYSESDKFLRERLGVGRLGVGAVYEQYLEAVFLVSIILFLLTINNRT